MIVASQLSQIKMQEIVDKYHEDLNKDYVDEEIISMMKNRIKHNEKYKYGQEYEEYASKREYWWKSSGSFFVQEKCTLPSLQQMEKTIIYNHFKKHAKELNLNLYFNFFDEFGYDKCFEYIKCFSENQIITDNMTNEQLISIYKKFLVGKCYNTGFWCVINKVRELVFKKQCQDSLPISQEIALRLNTLSKGPLLYDLNLHKVKLNKKDMKEIIKDLFSEKYIEEFCFPYISDFIEDKKELINEPEKKKIFKKIYSYERPYDFIRATYNYVDDNFLFTDILNDEQKKLILSKLYKIIKPFAEKQCDQYCSYNEKLNTIFNWEHRFLRDFENNYPEKEKFRDTILNEIIEDIKNENGLYLTKWYKLMEDFIYLSEGNLSQESINKIYELVKQDNKLSKNGINTSEIEKRIKLVKV